MIENGRLVLANFLIFNEGFGHMIGPAIDSTQTVYIVIDASVRVKAPPATPIFFDGTPLSA